MSFWKSLDISPRGDAYVLTKYKGSAQHVVIPRIVTEICEYCFSGCESLSGIVFKEGSHLKKIGNYAFEGSGLTSLQIPKSVEEIGALFL